MKTRTRHISFITALAVLFFTAIAISTPMRSAAELSAEKGFILIKSKVGDETVEGIKWKVFAIGERSNNKFVLNDTFAGSGVTLDDMSAEAVKADAETLREYVFNNQIQPDFEEASDENGAAQIYAQKAGIYFIYSNDTDIDKYTYRSTPAIVELKEDEGAVVLAKIEKEKTQDDESGPDESSHDTHDSTSSCDSSEDSDTSDRDTPESNSSGSDSSTSDSTSSTSDNDSSRGTGSGTGNNSGDKTQGGGSSEKLPQTGQLWWPVPVLSISGLALIALGMRVSFKKDGKDD